MGRPRTYVASPLGFTAAGRHWYGEVLLPALAAVVEPVDPWALTAPEEAAAATVGRTPEEQRPFWLEVGRRNAEALRTCDRLVAVLEGQEPDSGTVAELGFAAALGLRCDGLRTDLRRAGEPGMAVNLQVEAFVVHSGGRICADLDDLVRELGASG
ncbi:nucleoside 2-deoxyribosyltransferase [Conexibacter sp. SYSU D00693]|uniref:nucleoside 2-deoxyribosyltransferase n=1 Tax=Conexibacter sp. SYSU D00693 TaxID=2812560 RepID=UPI00196A99C3|nr:nucleoside 2-deoxyribosyltransferase [Conexibacter sp. SYSU D00693]